MEHHFTWGAIIIMFIQIASAAWSEFRKLRSEASIKRTVETSAQDVKQVAATKAEQVATVQQMVAQETKRQMELMLEELRRNTDLTEHAVEVNKNALAEANNFNAKFQVLAEADAEKMLMGRFAEVIGRDEISARIEKDTNKRVRDMQQDVQEIAQQVVESGSSG